MLPLFDTALLGTPVQLLQIPGNVQQGIISSMQRASIHQHSFTQDGKQLSELQSSLTDADDRACADTRQSQVHYESLTKF